MPTPNDIVACPSCGRRLVLANASAAVPSQCPGCGHVFSTAKEMVTEVARSAGGAQVPDEHVTKKRFAQAVKSGESSRDNQGGTVFTRTAQIVFALGTALYVIALARGRADEITFGDIALAPVFGLYLGVLAQWAVG